MIIEKSIFTKIDSLALRRLFDNYNHFLFCCFKDTQWPVSGFFINEKNRRNGKKNGQKISSDGIL